MQKNLYKNKSDWNKRKFEYNAICLHLVWSKSDFILDADGRKVSRDPWCINNVFSLSDRRILHAFEWEEKFGLTQSTSYFSGTSSHTDVILSSVGAVWAVVSARLWDLKQDMKREYCEYRACVRIGKLSSGVTVICTRTVIFLSK